MSLPVVVVCYDDPEGHIAYDPSEICVIYLDGYMESEGVKDLPFEDVIGYVNNIVLAQTGVWDQLTPSQKAIIASHLNQIYDLRDDLFFDGEEGNVLDGTFFGIPEGEEDIPVEELQS